MVTSRGTRSPYLPWKSNLVLNRVELTDEDKMKRGDVDEVEGELKAKQLQRTLVYEVSILSIGIRF